MNRVRKYAAVYRISLQNELAYRAQVFVGTIFLVVILFVFIELWAATFHSSRHAMLAGYTARSIVYYLVVTEAIIMGTPRLVAVVAQEVKEGDIAYRLTKPLSYIGFHYFTFLAQASVRIAINFAVGSLVAMWAYGWQSVTFLQTVFFLLAIFFSVSLSFSIYMLIALGALWIEDTRGIELVVMRLTMILGGMMIPLPLFPQWLARMCMWLPFQVIAYSPGRILADYSVDSTMASLRLAAVWLLLTAVAMMAVYQKGVRKLHVQGG